MPVKILVVDDEKSMCEFLEIMLSKEGYDVVACTKASAALNQLKKEFNSDTKTDLVITDLMMPEMSGIDFLKQAKTINQDLDFLVMTAFASVETAIEAMKNGAFDYITKPFKVDEIKLAVNKVKERRFITSENKILKQKINSGFESFITNDSQIKNILKMARKVANSDTTVLILGESGTGKEVLSRAIHSDSNRSDHQFVSINCGALPENLLESELFGHVKGSFTGAVKDKEGLFKVAENGTVFLDEIGETTPAIQVKLLKALEEKKITPIGGTKPESIDVRIIAATNADLESLVKRADFRPDLFYRLNVFPLTIPPLRKRRGDIQILAGYFVKRHCAKLDIAEKAINPETMNLLNSYKWPGNVRELENMLERAVLLSQGETIQPVDLPDIGDNMQSAEPGVTTSIITSDIPENLTDLVTIEKAYIHYVLSQTNWHKAKAARILGIDTSTLYRKIERYGFETPSLAK